MDSLLICIQNAGWLDSLNDTGSFAKHGTKRVKGDAQVVLGIYDITSKTSAKLRLALRKVGQVRVAYFFFFFFGCFDHQKI